MSIEGKVVLVTGAAQGIGRGIALRLAKDGADIALVDLKADRLTGVAAEIAALGRKTVSITADISKRDDVYAAIDKAEQALGGFDVIVNNAGIAQVNPIASVTPEEVERIFGSTSTACSGAFRRRRPSSRPASRRARSSTPHPLLPTMGLPCSASTQPPSSPCVVSRRPPRKSMPAPVSR